MHYTKGKKPDSERCMIHLYVILENAKPGEQKTDQWMPWAELGKVPLKVGKTALLSLPVLFSQAFSESRLYFPNSKVSIPCPPPPPPNLFLSFGKHGEGRDLCSSVHCSTLWV